MLSQGAQDKVSQTRSPSPGLSHGDTSLVRKEKAPRGATATVSTPGDACDQRWRGWCPRELGTYTLWLQWQG